jgi:restriction system protein
MTRRKSFVSLMQSVARESARAAREAERARVREIRELEKQVKLRARTQKESAAHAMELDAESQNCEIERQLSDLATILENRKGTPYFDFDSMKVAQEFPPLVPRSQFYELPPNPPTWIQRNWPPARTQYQNDLLAYEERKKSFERALAEEKNQHEREKTEYEEKVRQYALEIDAFRDAYSNGTTEAVVAYHVMMLEKSHYPDDFPNEFRVAYVPESKQLVIEYRLPALGVIPTVAEVRYVKTQKKLSTSSRKQREIKELYQDLICSIPLRILHETFISDVGGHIDVIALNGYVRTRDPATGKQIKPYLLSVRVTKERFQEIDLNHINKSVCLRNLAAQVSKAPDEMIPVRPVVDFDMVDKRFIAESDVISELDERPNLMDLTPGQFENLVTNLFSKQGLEAKLTRSTKDGGVDCVAFFKHELLGGKFVIQAKRYRHTVGVSAVRDLYGTMMNEGATKGILVTTSGYGTDAFDFAKDKPIQLISGSELLYLLEEVGIKARIIFPDETIV